MRHEFSRLLRAALPCLVMSTLAASLPAASQQPATRPPGHPAPRPAAEVVAPLELTIFNATPGAQVTVSLEKGIFTGPAAALGSTPAAVAAAVKLDKGTLSLTIPAGALPSGGATVSLTVPARMTGSAIRLKAAPPLVLAARSGTGGPPVVNQGGEASVQLFGDPPTCARLGCGPSNPCPQSYCMYNGKPIPGCGCYGYMGVFYCCIDPPYSAQRMPAKPGGASKP
jgi:hypothetical protein